MNIIKPHTYSEKSVKMLNSFTFDDFNNKTNISYNFSITDAFKNSNDIPTSRYVFLKSIEKYGDFIVFSKIVHPFLEFLNGQMVDVYFRDNRDYFKYRDNKTDIFKSTLFSDLLMLTNNFHSIGFHQLNSLHYIVNQIKILYQEYMNEKSKESFTFFLNNINNDPDKININQNKLNIVTNTVDFINTTVKIIKSDYVLNEKYSKLIILNTENNNLVNTYPKKLY
jgi:hypothetical protein